MGYRLLATVALILHFAYLAYVVLGGFIAWAWPRTIWLHLAAVAWGVAVVGAGLPCPLTALENWARRRAGEAGLTAGFVDRFVEGVVYPERYTNLLRALVGLAILASWVGFARRRQRVAAHG